MPLHFSPSPRAFTLGAEVELQVLDAHSFNLSPQAAELLNMLGNKRIIPEMFRSTIELITDIATDAHAIGNDLAALYVEVEKAAHRLGLRFASTGTHPVANYHEGLITDKPRYDQLLERNQWLIRRMAVYGLHVHIGMRSGDDALRFGKFFLIQLPLLLALTASSPFWSQADTGLSACRPTMYESHPTSGLPFLVHDWKQFESVYDAMIRTGSIESIKDIWWDVRPSPGYGTLELRFCDNPATLAESTSVIALIHMMALWYDDHKEDFDRNAGDLVQQRWILRENKWRAIRYGVRGSMIAPGSHGVQSFTEAFDSWCDKLSHYATLYGYDGHLQVLKDVFRRGNSADRQRRVYAETHDLRAVVKHNADEFSLRRFI